MKLDRPYAKLKPEEKILRRELKKIQKAATEIMKLGRYRYPTIKENVVYPNGVYVEVVEPETGESLTYGDSFLTS